MNNAMLHWLRYTILAWNRSFEIVMEEEKLKSKFKNQVQNSVKTVEEH